MTTLRMAAFAAALIVPSLALAQPQDRVTFGGDAVVRPGEVVQDLVTMGGDALVEGEVLGDVVTMGGDLRVEPGGEIHGDLVTMGGDVSVADGAKASGERVGLGAGVPGVSFGPTGGHDGHGGFGAWLVEFLSSLVSYALLFVLGLVLMGVARERLDALQVVIARQPLRAVGMGVLGFVGALVSIVVLAITILGIPAAVLLAFALPFAIYVGLAAAASVVGAILPVRALADRPVLQLAAGCGVLWLASLVPFAGEVAVAFAAILGLGALVVTRFGKVSSLDLGPDPVPSGPYRTSAV